MSRHATVLAMSKANKRPTRRVVLTPAEFADTWKDKPETEVAIGLRLLSDGDVQQAKIQADRQANQWYADHASDTPSELAYIESFNDAVMRFCIARACVDVNDISRPYFTDYAEDVVRFALPSSTVARLWDELLDLHACSSVRTAPAKDEEIEQLAHMLLDGRALSALTPAEQLEMRRRLARCFIDLGATGKAPAVDSESDSDVYVARLTD